MRLFCVCGLTALVLGLTSCNRDNTGSIYGGNSGLDKEHTVRMKVVEDNLPRLSYFAEIDNPDKEVAFYDATRALIGQGSSIEARLIEALATSDDWAQRYGVITVLDAIGTRACVPMLIESLSDEHPLVGLKAVSLLRVLCNHREVPPAGASALDGLPPVPEVGPDNFQDDAEVLLWEQWYDQYNPLLRQRWTAWWKDNKREVVIN